MRRLILLLMVMFAVPALAQPSPDYYTRAGHDDAWSGGVRMIPITHAEGHFRVWTKRVGNNPRMKVLLLHGGPARPTNISKRSTAIFPGAGIEYYYYDQLGSAYSDQPNDAALWDAAALCRRGRAGAPGAWARPSNFYLFGHSWGGMLAMEYALKYQQHLKGLIISNMMASSRLQRVCPDVLMPAMDQGSCVSSRRWRRATAPRTRATWLRWCRCTMSSIS